MSTLLLRLAGPMQSWGTQSRFSVRDTGLEPSKSGVIGLLCAALGKPREERVGDGFPALAELAALRMGVRVDREGVPKVDYHTAGGTHRRGQTYGVVRASGKPGETVTSRRHYLADADFLVGLESDEGLLRRLDEALARPHWQLSLGRKSFVPSVPVRLPDGIRAGSLEISFESYVVKDRHVQQREPTLRVVLDARPEEATEVRADVPLSFAERRFVLRHVRTHFITSPYPSLPGDVQEDGDVPVEVNS